ncbi:hypothetical protein, partial [Alcanivorax jadensis]|uniref:hypothetical protein n=1 Tax=Alcanivorax jadensis TaxID=64988 RepID=UPI0026E9F553
PGLALLVFIFGFGKSQLAHGIPGKWLIESPDYGKVGEFFRGSLTAKREKQNERGRTHDLGAASLLSAMRKQLASC